MTEKSNGLALLTNKHLLLVVGQTIGLLSHVTEQSSNGLALLTNKHHHPERNRITYSPYKKETAVVHNSQAQTRTGKYSFSLFS